MGKRITVDDLDKERFYMLPKELFLSPTYRGKINSNAKLVYAILKDRLELSRKNNWINENRELYLKFKREKLEKLMSISDKTLTNAMNQLKDVGLIEEERLGLGKVNRIYICDMKTATAEEIEKLEEEYQEDFESIEDYSEEVQEIKKCPQSTINSLNRKNYESRIVKTTNQESEKLRLETHIPKLTDKQETSLKICPNDTYYNDTYLNDTTTRAKTGNDDVVVSDAEVIAVKEKIDKKLNAKISKKAVKELLNQSGNDRVNYYLENWDKFKSTTKGNIVGFFVKAVQENYIIPSTEKATSNNFIEQHENFEQRQYSESDFEKYYYKVE